MLYEAWRMKPNEGEETQREVEEELARSAAIIQSNPITTYLLLLRKSILLTCPLSEHPAYCLDPMISCGCGRRGSTPSLVVEAGDPGPEQREEEGEGEESSLQQQDSITATSHRREQGTRSLGQTIREKSWFGKKCVKIFRVFSNTFAMTFLAEWGDRSQVGPPGVCSVCIRCAPAGDHRDGGY